MRSRPILVDVTRLLTRRLHRSPTGIDRADLAYALHYLARPESDAVAITRWGVRLVPKPKVGALLALLGQRWPTGDRSHESRSAALRVERWLAGGPDRPDRRGRRAGSLVHALDRSLVSVESIGWPKILDAARGAVYLHTSHIRLDQPRHFAWLDRRPDVKPVFFVHDLIPIEFPEYAVPGQAERHRTRMETVARRGAAIVTGSRHVAQRFAAFAAKEGWPAVPAVTAAYGVEDAFTSRPGPFAASRPYFVICSTIEARKNHLLVLQIWRDLAARLGEATPALVIVGRRGWESESAIDLLDRCPALEPHVIEASGLATGDLARLVAGAHALLMPSFVEGYGMPVAEALSVGTPVIASDIPAHREVAEGTGTVFLDPLDGVGWRNAVTQAAARRTADREPSGYVPPSWAAHFAAVDGALSDLPPP